MPYDSIETGRVKSTATGSSGDLQATLTDVPEGDLERCTVHLPACLDFRPLDGKGDAVYAANGDVCEVLNVDCVSARKAFRQSAGDTPAGGFRLYSLGQTPEGLVGTDSELKLGASATRGIARQDDETDEGTISIVVTPAVPPLPGTLTFSYTDALGNTMTPPLTLTIPGLAVTSGSIAPIPNRIRIRGKIVTSSTYGKCK